MRSRRLRRYAAVVSLAECGRSFEVENAEGGEVILNQ
jgi:hypothetical protein